MSTDRILRLVGFWVAVGAVVAGAPAVSAPAIHEHPAEPGALGWHTSHDDDGDDSDDDSDNSDEVLSIFTATRAYRVPPRRLAHGRRYVWRVWPYMERTGYTTRPLAVSWFATPPRPRP